jgi:2-methylcitrate dehydratase PrpD
LIYLSVKISVSNEGDEMNISQQFAANVVKTDFNSLDQLSVSRARWRILDTIGCAFAGANAAGCREMLNLITKWGGAPESTVLVHNIKVPALNAAMMNSLMARSFDFEPVEAEGEDSHIPAHVSGTNVPVALAVAETRGASGRDLITALVLGDDIVCRLGIASGSDFSGWENTGTINGFGAAAIAGKLMGLNEGQLHNAFGIVLNQLGGSMDNVKDKTMSFKLPMALVARNGIFSAELAGQGFIGVNDPFLGSGGFFKLYCKKYNTQDILKNLGQRYYADAVIKPYPCCRLTHSSIDSALKVTNESTYEVSDVQEIQIKVTPGIFNGFCGQPYKSSETSPVNAAFSIRYTVACALLHKSVQLRDFTETAIKNPEIMKLVDKMTLMPDIPPEKELGAQVCVKMKKGQVLCASTDLPGGQIFKNPLADEEIMSKFLNNLAYSGTVYKKKAEKLLEMLLKLEDIKDIRSLTEFIVN